MESTIDSLERKIDKLLDERDYRIAHGDDKETIQDIEDYIVELREEIREMIRENY